MVDGRVVSSDVVRTRTTSLNKTRLKAAEKLSFVQNEQSPDNFSNSNLALKRTCH
jgi:hypothetical protein